MVSTETPGKSKSTQLFLYQNLMTIILCFITLIKLCSSLVVWAKLTTALAP